MNRIGFVGLICLIAAPSTSAWAKNSSNDVTVCVDVVVKTHKSSAETTQSGPSDTPSPPPVKLDAELSDEVLAMLNMWEAEERKKIRSRILRQHRKSYAFAPMSYLERMLEHYITYERGFAAVQVKCSERLTVELYPLEKGWTAFAYYSGHQQEEKVDQIEYAEFPRFAKRVVTALLYNKRIEQTIDRLNVLKADSIQNIETVKGTHHVTAAVGSSFQFPIEGMATAVTADGAPENEFRLLTPVNLQLGYRGSFTSWCVEAYTRFGFGVSRKAQINNVKGGHVDHVLDMNLGLAFLWYVDPNGFNSFYTGTGASFDLRWYESVKPKSNPNHLNNDKLFGAGVSLHGILGYEFLRTSRIRAFTQLEVNLPAYRIDAENDITSLKTWMPGATLTAGVMF